MVRLSALLVTLLVLSAVAAPPASAGLGAAAIALEPVISLTQPIAMADRLADDDLYIATKPGRVFRVTPDGETSTEILDITSKVSTDGERGLLGLTIPTAGDRLYVCYTNNDGDVVVRSYPFDGTEIDDADGVNHITVEHSGAPNHNGGNIAFGPDGPLYIGTGDGGGQNDPENDAQRLDSLLGKILRIDPVATGGFTVPAGNPYADPGDGRQDEIWVRGLRNPWRFSFDSQNGTLWIGDVGGSRREEIDRQSPSSDGGENYGWRRMEGSLTNVGRPLPADKHAEPFFEYRHRNGNCAITGGYVYRGSAIPDLAGAFVFADFCVGKLRAIDATDRSNRRSLDVTQPQVASFGQDGDGELYVLSLGGAVSRIVPAT